MTLKLNTISCTVTTLRNVIILKIMSPAVPVFFNLETYRPIYLPRRRRPSCIKCQFYFANSFLGREGGRRGGAT